jgi:hypothetical protein
MDEHKWMRGLLMTGLMLACAAMAAQAQAAFCQGFSTTWEQTFFNACSGRLDAAAGTCDAAHTQKCVLANLRSGTFAATQGINGGGFLIPGCFIGDSTADAVANTDVDGCNTGVRFVYRVDF